MTDWLEIFEPAFGHRAQRGGLRRYAEGVLSDSRRKSMEAMWARLRDPGSYQALQYFITEAEWSADGLWRRVRAAIPARAGVLVLDGTGLPKQGRASVGVGRQYSGTLGKIGNCQYHVRQGGCAACPIRCHYHLEVPQLEQYGVSRFVATTCTRQTSAQFYQSVPGGGQSQTRLEMACVGAHLLDDYGIWTHYNQTERDFRWAYKAGVFKASLPADEYKAIPWDLYERKDPMFLWEIHRRIAYKVGLLGTAFGEGPGRTAELLKFPKEYFTDPSLAYWKMGSPQHHAHGDNGQVGVLINLIYNRDAVSHANSNLTLSGLPAKVLVGIGDKLWGQGSVDPRSNYTPMNPNKARWAIWGLLRKEMHDSLTLCNYTWPMSCSPLK